MRSFVIPTFMITLIGGFGIIFFHSLNKQHKWDWNRFNDAWNSRHFGAYALEAGPLLANLLLAIFWRRRHPFAGFVVAVMLAGVTATGQLFDWMAWAETPAPQDQVTYLAGFIAAIVAWVILLCYWIAGLFWRSDEAMKSTPWV